MPNRPPRIITRQRLLVCILINQLATPGMGSIMAGRRVSGVSQLSLALAGCALIVVWMFKFFYRLTMKMFDEPGRPGSPDWLWQWGAILFGIAWCWSLVTSLALWIEMKKLPDPGISPAPPRIRD